MGGSIYFNAGGSSSMAASFGIGLTALNAAKIAMSNTGHNIANANTEGYSRRELVTTTMTPQQSPYGALGRGVKVENVRAVRDTFLEAQLALESQAMGRLDTLDIMLTRMESVFNPISSIGLTDAADNFFGAFHDLAANPENVAQREAVLQEAQSMGSSSRHTIDQLKGIKSSINSQMRIVAQEVNTLLQDIASLNVQLSGSESMGSTSEDLRDTRNLRFQQLNELVGVQGYENESSSLTVITKNGAPLVIQNQYSRFDIYPNAQDPNSVDVISTFNNVPTDITDVIDSGRMGGLIQMRDTILEEAISQQHLFAAELQDAVNIEHKLGTDLDGNQGGEFFREVMNSTDSSLTSNLNSITMVGDNANFEVNYDLDVTATSGATITAINFDVADRDILRKHNYKIVFTNGTGDHRIRDMDTGEVFQSGNLAGPGNINFHGLNVAFDAVPDNGDTYELNFQGHEGMTGDEYAIEWITPTDYEVYNTSEKDPNPVATGTLAAVGGLIFVDGLAIEISGPRAAGDFFKIGYSSLVAPSILATEIAASGSAPGLPEPGNNENALRIADLGYRSNGGLGGISFSQFQSSVISNVGSTKGSNNTMRTAQVNFMSSLHQQRESVSGVSMDEEAASLVELQQSFSAASRFISKVNEMLDFLINNLG
jgi:flagellar hook-associated protein 1 FlgK